MARLTVEQKWWIDPRRSFLMGRLDKPDYVDGLMVMVWRIAQEYWGQGQQLIPWRVFSKFSEYQKVIDADLAEIRNGPKLDSSIVQQAPSTFEEIANTFVYVRGSKDYFTWILDIREKRKKGGIESAKRPRDAKGRLKKNPKKSPAPVQHPSSTSPSESSTVQVSGSGSGLGSEEKKNTFLTESVEHPPQAAGSLPAIPAPKNSRFSEQTRVKMQAFIAAYAKGYREKHGGNPEGIRDKALIGKLGHWIESVSQERAVNLVEVYLQVDYRPINDSYHDLWQFFRHLNRIGIALDSGQTGNGIDWGKVFA